MKRMSATITLKELRTNPRHYVDLLNLGYIVSLTDHGKVLVVTESATPGKSRKKHKLGTVGAVLDAIDHLPPLKRPVPDADLTYKEMMAKHRQADYEKLRKEIDGGSS